MNILITGANGFIGSHITQELINHGHHLTLCVRNTETVERRWPDAKSIKMDFCNKNKVADWLPHLNEIDLVINSVGIIRETGSQTFTALHTTTPSALFKACEIANVKKVIQISALGTDANALSQYHRSKYAADQYLASLSLNWAILMPSIVYGSGAKSMAFFKSLAALPWIPLVDKGDQPIQPIHIDDLVKAVLQLIPKESANQLRIACVGPEAITFKQLFTQLRQWLSLPPGRFISMGYHLTLIAGKFGGFLGNTPVTTETIQMLRQGNTADVTPFIKQFGFTPISVETSLSNTPATTADKWHAGLYFLRPLLRISIALLWIFTGIVSAFVFPVEQSYAMLAMAGITGSWAPFMLYGAAATDIALGVATLLAYRLNLVGMTQIAIIVLYTTIISATQAEQWLHPFGPISKNIPLIIATLIMLVLERERWNTKR